jgi:hypothetical protein
MNRPLWLDLLYVAGFFVPPTLVAAVGADFLSNWCELGGWAAVATYVGLAVIATVLWLVGLVAWARITSPQSGDNLQGVNQDGDRHGQN